VSSSENSVITYSAGGATTADSNSSAENLIQTPTRKNRNLQSATSNLSSSGTRKSITAAQPAKKPLEQVKSETQHKYLTCNHLENNYHLSNKKAIYYNMKVYYDSVQ
jgi:hypothetical protein